jgi:CRP-like cAMP-binding protein
MPLGCGDTAVARYRNHLLNALSVSDQGLLNPLLKRVKLHKDDVLFEPQEEIKFVYFFEGGLSSEIATNPERVTIEVGCVGWEGMSGIPIILGSDRSAHRSFMQIGGTALRIASSDIITAMKTSETLRAMLLRYAHVFMMQIASTALADGKYNIQERLCRWLLMSQDRVGSNIPLTHDFLALMLGVRRPGVTDALHVLEGEHAIKSFRATVVVTDRPKLERMAKGSYGVAEAEFRRLILDPEEQMSATG